MIPIRTIAHRKTFTTESLRQEHHGLVVACDFYVDGAERGQDIPGGYEIDGILNIDHHSPAEHMMRNVTSTNLALGQIRHSGPLDPDAMVIISHTDCDSVLSASVMAGELPLDDKFGAAAVAADHTGTANQIADVLQSLEWKRDFYFSLRNLRKLLDGQPLDRTAQPSYLQRLRKREAAEAAIIDHRVQVEGKLAFGVLESQIDGEFFPSKLPSAALILLMSPRPNSNRWDAKMRLGQTAPRGASLHHLRPERFDPAFAGRWNAGSNARNGGTDMKPDAYAQTVAQVMRETWGV
jgi:hypothetical protein